MAISIHVIESEDALAGQLVRALARFGVQAKRSVDGNEGVRRALNDRPAALILGLMEKGAGYALCSKLRRKSRDIPILMIIDAAEQAGPRLAEHRSLNTAADAYLQRPFSVRALHDTLASLVAAELPIQGDADELIGQPGDDAVFDGLFEGEEDADIEAATEKWFDSIMSRDSAPPADRPPPPRVVHNPPSIEDLEINLDELVPPAEDEVIATLRRENANLRGRVMELETLRGERPSRISTPSSTANRRELLEMRQRLSDRERELLDLRDKYTLAETEAIELEEALEDLRKRSESIEKRLEEAESRARREASAHEEAEAHVQRLRQQLTEERQARESAERGRGEADEELVPLRAELQALKKSRDEATRALEELRQSADTAQKVAQERIADLGAEIDDARSALAEAKKTHADSDARFQAEISALKASHADDLQTLEMMQEEAAAQALSERERRHHEAIALVEAKHAEALATLTDRAEVAESALGEKDKALAEYREALAEADRVGQRALREHEAQLKSLTERAGRLPELERQATEQAARLATLEQAHAALTEDLSRAEKTLVGRERALVEARHARQAAETRLEQLLSRAAAREAALEKVRTALTVANAFLERAVGESEPRSDGARDTSHEA